MNIKFLSRTRERTASGIANTVVYQGSLAEMEQLAADHPVGEYTADGRLKTLRLYQDSPEIWSSELRYESDPTGDVVIPPDTAYGKKSARLRGSLLSLALECHPDYLAHWNYYLAAAPGVTASPRWFLTATDILLSEADSQKYQWVKSSAECPAATWFLIAKPEMPGVSTYDAAVYSITESARFRSAAAAGRMVSEKLNKVGRPENEFGFVVKGDYKCDDASIEYTGKFWLATLTWTGSGDAAGWNKTLYTQGK